MWWGARWVVRPQKLGSAGPWGPRRKGQTYEKPKQTVRQGRTRSGLHFKAQSLCRRATHGTEGTAVEAGGPVRLLWLSR